MDIVSDGLNKRIIKDIKVGLDKCIGCRACEMACSGFHAVPKFSSANPARSRIRVIVEDRKDVYVAIRAGDYVQAECNGRNSYVINGKEYSECCFCTVSCSVRDLFRGPDSGLPLRCDMCADDPTLPEPMCVQVCRCDALTYFEWEEDLKVEEAKRDDLEVGLEFLMNRYGIDKVDDTFAHIYKTLKRTLK